MTEETPVEIFEPVIEQIPVENFAQLDETNTIIQLLVVGQNVLVDEQGNPLSFPESEPVGQAFLVSIFGPSVWKQACKDDPAAYRGMAPGVGDKYDPEKDEFYDPTKPRPESDEGVQPSQLF